MTTMNGIEYVVKTLPANKISLKATNKMKAKGYTIHNTYNDAAALSEINYMQNVNPASTSYTFAVDNLRIVQGLPLDRNGWHGGDGSNGYGNRNTWGVEICYSKSGGERYDKAETNAILFVAQGLYDNGWDISKVWKHKDWSGKNCPHRILARSRGWEGIIKAIQKELDRLKGKKPSKTPKPKPSNSSSIDKLAKEVIDGKHGSGEARKKSLGGQYTAVQKRVNELLSGKAKPPKTSKKGIDTLAREVIDGKHGSGEARKKTLGSRYESVQKRVNELLNPPKKKKAKGVETLAKEVIDGKHGSGEARKKSLGGQYTAVQKRVNEILSGGKKKKATPKKSLKTLVDEVNRGVHGSGEARKKSLGSDYNRVQKEINRLYG